MKQIYDNENDLSFTDHGTPVNRAIKSLKLNINEQLEEALEILRDPNHQLSSKNDDKSQRVNEIDSPRVKKNSPKRQEYASAPKVPVTILTHAAGTE